MTRTVTSPESLSDCRLSFSPKAVSRNGQQQHSAEFARQGAASLAPYWQLRGKHGLSQRVLQ